MFRTNESKSLKMCGVLVLVLVLWTGCSDDEGTKKKEPEKKTTPKKTTPAKKVTPKKTTPKKTTPKKTTPVARAPQKIYVWSPTDTHDGNLRFRAPGRENIDLFCSVGADASSGKPGAITAANYVTKTFVLSDPFNNFADLGAQVLRDGAYKDTLTKDEVHGLSGAGANTKLADNYGAFTTGAWASSLADANVGDTGEADQRYWIGLDATAGSADGTKHATNYHCQDFNSNRDGQAVGRLSAIHEGSYILETNASVDVGGANVSPLMNEAGTEGCNETYYFLCISFPRN